MKVVEWHATRFTDMYYHFHHTLSLNQIPLLFCQVKNLISNDNRVCVTFCQDEQSGEKQQTNKNNKNTFSLHNASHVIPFESVVFLFIFIVAMELQCLMGLSVGSSGSENRKHETSVLYCGGLRRKLSAAMVKWPIQFNRNRCSSDFFAGNA